MAKYMCAICRRELGAFSSKTIIFDGAVCSECLTTAGISHMSNPKSYSTSSIIKLCESKRELNSSFNPNKEIKGYIQFDEKNRLFSVHKNIFEYSNLVSYDLQENGETITKGGLGRAVAGGLLFGGVGAIVGGVTGKKKTSGICTSLKLLLMLKDTHRDSVYINFISCDTKTKSFSYQNYKHSAQQCIAALQIILDYNRHNYTIEPPAFSVADELIKFKQLLDSGAITQEEFDTKKKQLLD